MGPARRWVRFLTIPLAVAVDLLAGVWAWSAFSNGLWLVGSVIVVIALAITLAASFTRAIALRWLLPALALLVAFAVAPIVYTGYVALTNYNGTHLLTRQQALDALERQTIVSPTAVPFAWAAYETSSGQLALFLVPQSSSAGASDQFAPANGTVQSATPGTGIFGPPDPNGFPTTIEGFTRIDPIATVQRINEISAEEYGTPPDVYRVVSISQASEVTNQYQVNPDGSVTDVTTGIVYRPQSTGYFESADGTRIQPAFQNFVGFDNVVRLFTNPALRGPFLSIAAWTIVFSVVVVALQFALALLYAVILNSSFVRPRVARAVRAILLLPYVIPAYLMILTWASLFNAQTGLIPTALNSVFGLDPTWFGTTLGARIAMLVVGVWLGFPYFLLINTGALQAVPQELLEAGAVDGASAVRSFRSIVLPILTRTVAPLIVLAIAFNFNNFYLAYLLFGGGPQMPQAQVPAGETDLLISFAYKVSFGSVGGGNDYALAAVITSLIFLALTPVVVAQLTYYNRWRRTD